MKINTAYFKEKGSFFKVFIFFVSWGLVGFGGPSWSPFLGVFSSCIGLALFWLILKEITPYKTKFLISLFWFFCIQLIQLSWMSSLEYQGKYILIVYLLLSLALGAQFAWLSLYVPTDKKDFTFSKIMALCGFWVLLEWGRLFFMSGFPFNPIGLSLSSTVLGRQGASLAGVYGLSFWVIMTNLLGLKMLYTREKKAAFVWLILAIAPYLYGIGHLSYHLPKSQKANSLRLLLVQTALSPIEKTGMKGYENMMPPIEQWAAIFSYLSSYRDQKHDLIVLPECSVPFSESYKLYPENEVKSLIRFYFKEKGEDVFSQMGHEEILDNLAISQFLARFFKAQVLVGLEHFVESDSNEDLAYASCFCVHPDGTYEVYDKRILLPIVEYLPFQWCKDLAKKYNIHGWYEQGKSSKVFQGVLPFSPSICIEELYGSLLRKNRLLGAKLFVNLTNDVWFPNSKLPKQHFEHGLIRCLENGVATARACNTGVTGVIDALGRPVSIFGGFTKDNQWQKGALSVFISSYFYNPPFLFYGNHFIVLLSFCSLIIHGLKSKLKYKLSLQS